MVNFECIIVECGKFYIFNENSTHYIFSSIILIYYFCDAFLLKRFT